MLAFKNYYPIFSLLILLLLPACGESTTQKEEKDDPAIANLKSSMTLAANFDQGYDANFAAGDPKVYTGPAYDSLDAPTAGMTSSEIALLEGKGKSGNALQFKSKAKPVIFYKSEKNIAYSKENWSGTVSLWLSLNPEEDLAPGYTDPIQITDQGYDDAAIWVDFSNKNPRSFRMGVYGDVDVWNPDNIGPDENPAFNSRLLPATDRPFTRESWTHVAVSFSRLNTQNGRAEFFINGKSQGTRDITEPYTWELEKSRIFLGLNFVGLMDEVSIYNKALTADEIKSLYELPGGLTDLL
ncbi:MAG: LamG domain-containing protein [Bacteroidota bacterium]